VLGVARGEQLLQVARCVGQTFAEAFWWLFIAQPAESRAWRAPLGWRALARRPRTVCGRKTLRPLLCCALASRWASFWAAHCLPRAAFGHQSGRLRARRSGAIRNFSPICEPAGPRGAPHELPLLPPLRLADRDQF